MKSKILNYLIIIEPDERTGTGERGYFVFCPALGLADGGDTIEETIKNMEKLIAFHLECLQKEERSRYITNHCIKAHCLQFLDK